LRNVVNWDWPGLPATVGSVQSNVNSGAIRMPRALASPNSVGA
jgi:hypothetical protein